MRFAVIRFGGTNCDLDVVHVLRHVCGVETDHLWYKDRAGREYDAIVLPGGFSYGDYLRAGAIAARTPVMEGILRHVREGRLALGICNGAQIAAESGLVPGTFTLNAYPKFLCRPAHLRVETNGTPFTTLYREGEVISIPIAHKEGRYMADPETLATLNRKQRVVFRFCDPEGKITGAVNHNGSAENITGVLGDGGNFLAMMPHPERASEEILGSEDGKKIFLSMIRYIEEKG